MRNRGDQALHVTCQRRILGIQWHDFVTNVDVQRRKLSNVLEIIARRGYSLFGHVRLLDPSTPAHAALRLRVDSHQARKWLEAPCPSASSLVDLTAGGGLGSICPEVVEGVGGSTTLRRFTRMIIIINMW